MFYKYELNYGDIQMIQRRAVGFTMADNEEMAVEHLLNYYGDYELVYLEPLGNVIETMNFIQG